MVDPLKLNILPNDRELEISGSLFCLYGKNIRQKQLQSQAGRIPWDCLFHPNIAMQLCSRPGQRTWAITGCSYASKIFILDGDTAYGKALDILKRNVSRL